MATTPKQQKHRNSYNAVDLIIIKVKFIEVTELLPLYVLYALTDMLWSQLC